jgi:hypothetical protein
MSYNMEKIIKMKRYKTNLKVLGNRVYSYDTHVATIDNKNLYQLDWWSVTTQKHINYVAKELNLYLMPIPKEKNEQRHAISNR